MKILNNLNLRQSQYAVGRKAERAQDQAVIFAMYLAGNKPVKIDNGRVWGFLWKRSKKDSPTVRELLDKYEPTPVETLKREDDEAIRKSHTQPSSGPSDFSMLRRAKLFYNSWDEAIKPDYKYKNEVKAYEERARSRGLIE